MTLLLGFGDLRYPQENTPRPNILYSTYYNICTLSEYFSSKVHMCNFWKVFGRNWEVKITTIWPLWTKLKPKVRIRHSLQIFARDIFVTIIVYDRGHRIARQYDFVFGQCFPLFGVQRVRSFAISLYDSRCYFTVYRTVYKVNRNSRNCKTYY